MTLVMGMDQHRAQISAEWIDTLTAEISRARIAPADRMTSDGLPPRSENSRYSERGLFLFGGGAWIDVLCWLYQVSARLLLQFGGFPPVAAPTV